LHKLLLIALAGAMGTLSRYFLADLVQRQAGITFPIGTLVVNTLGCFLFGFVFALADVRYLISAETRIVLLTGFMGAFTTFSTYAFESAGLLRSAEWFWAAVNLGSHVVLGLIAVFAGGALARII
jgi:CrcB protein